MEGGQTKTAIRIVLTLTLCAPAYADIAAYAEWYQPYTEGDDGIVPEFNGRHWTVDLRVIVSDSDDWTGAAATATISHTEFFYHPLGDRTPSLAGLVLLFPALEFDTMEMSTEADLENQPSQRDPEGYTGGSFGAQRISVSWYGLPPNGGDGDFLLARYTIHAEEDKLPVTFHVGGDNMTVNGEGTLYPFDFWVTIPEPETLALLAMATALVRRR